MILKELALVLKGMGDGLRGLDISLTAVDDWYITQAKRNDTASKNIHDVSSNIPKWHFE